MTETVDIAGRDPLALPPDGPEEIGREIAQGPDVVAATLAEVEAFLPELDRLIAETERTVLVGTGASLVVAQAAAPSWRTIRRGVPAGVRRDVLVRQSTEVVLGDADGEAFEPTDLVFAISQTGTSPETLAAARLAARAGSSVVAVTGVSTSPSAQAASHVLWTASPLEDGASTQSALAALASLMGVAGALDPGERSREELADRLGEVVADWATAARFGHALAAAERTWMVGFGSAVGIVTAAALLWHEKVLRPAVATTVSELRHGPLEAVRPGDAVIVVDVDAPHPGRAAYLALLRGELALLGATVVEISPDAGGPDGIPISGTQPAGASLEALLRLQQLARAAAFAAGVYRDGFEILRTVVKEAEGMG